MDEEVITEEDQEEVISQETEQQSDEGWKTGDPLDQHPRFQEVYGERNKARDALSSYEEFGSFSDVKSKLDRLDEYETRIKEIREKQSMTQEEQDASNSNARIRKQMFDIVPELRRLEEFSESTYDDRYVSREEQNWERASDHLGSLLKANKIDVDRETQDDIEDFVLAKMTDHEKKSVASGDFSAVQSAYERISGSRFFKGLSGPSQNGDQPKTVSLESVPKRMKPGGTAAKPQSKKAKTWEDAEERGWAKMKESFPGG